MRIILTTNIDHYKMDCFPRNLTYVPRKGEMVMVSDVLHKYFQDKKLPIILEVVAVVHTDAAVICELWYTENQIKTAKQNGTNLF